MAADVLKYAIGNSSSTMSSSSINNTAITLPLTSDTNFAAKSGEGLVLIDEGEATEELAYSESKSGATLSIPLVNRGLEGGSAQAHVSGATVKGILTAGMWNNLIDAVSTVVSKVTGLLDVTKVVDLTTAQTLTNKTLTSPKINENVAVTSSATELNLLDGVTSLPTKATAANVVTGTLDTAYTTPKAIHDSGILTTKIVGIQVVDAAVSTSTGDGKAFFRVPLELTGMNLTGIAASVYTAGTTNSTTVNIRNKTDSQDMLSALMAIETGETDTSTSAQPGTINASYDDVVTGDILAIDVDTISTTAAKGLYVEMRFALP
jgi:hypothetical protein